MWVCPKCGEELDDQFDACWKCANRGVEISPTAGRAVPNVILSTTPHVPGRRILKSLGIVCGEAIVGASIFSDFAAGIADIVGGRAGSYENHLKEAREIALSDMGLEAQDRGANAVIGIVLDYETIRGRMLMVTASGTAVILKPDK